MNSRLIRALGIGLLLMVAVIIWRDYLPKKDDDVDIYMTAFEAIETTAVDEVRISENEQELVLIRDGFVWKVDNFLADTAMVTQLVEGLIQPETVQVVAEHSSSHEKLGFLEPPVTLTLGFGEEQKTLLVGNFSGTGRYVRFEDSEVVYLIEALPYAMASTSINDWVDKMLLGLDEKDIMKIRMTQGRKVITLSQQEGKWYQEGDDQALDANLLGPKLAALTSLRANELAGDQEMTVRAPNLIITLTTTNGEIELSLSPYLDEQVVVTSSAREGKFLISESVMESFLLTDTDLVPAPETSSDVPVGNL
jgi:hypothetical protein